MKVVAVLGREAQARKRKRAAELAESLRNSRVRVREHERFTGDIVAIRGSGGHGVPVTEQQALLAIAARLLFNKDGDLIFSQRLHGEDGLLKVASALCGRGHRTTASILANFEATGTLLPPVAKRGAGSPMYVLDQRVTPDMERAVMDLMQDALDSLTPVYVTNLYVRVMLREEFNIALSYISTGEFPRRATPCLI